MKTKPPAPAPKRPPAPVPPGDAPAPRKAPAPAPLGVDCALSRRQIQAALDIGRTKFLRMLANGEYPPPDVSLGDQSPRWHQSTHNAWLAAKRGAARG